MERLKILLVEDEPFDADRIELELSKAGHRVIEVIASGEAFISRAPSLEFDVALVDVQLEGDMDGIEAVKRLSSELSFPTIFLSAHDNLEFIRRAEECRPAAYLLKPFRERELLFLVNMACQRFRYEQQLITQRTEAEADLWFVATHDSLTGLPNRSLFQDRLYHILRRSKKEDYKVALIYLDIDNFKQINESEGHPVADELLRVIAKRILNLYADSGTVARIGGDEFAIIIEKVESSAILSHRIQKLLSQVQAPIKVGDTEYVMTASLGIATSRGDDDAELLMRNATSALYKAKRQGKNSFRFYTSEMTLQTQKRLQIEQALRRAIENDDLQLVYQPQIDMSDGVLLGAEALLRWQHPTQGLLMPEEFIPIAEESDLINKLGEWVLRKVCRQIIVWYEKGHSVNFISVNCSGRQLSHGPLASMVTRVLNETGCRPEFIELEITESMLSSEPGKARKELLSLAQHGVRIALDDFGTGYSSLAYIKNFPLHKLKIDRSFIKHVPDSKEDCAIVQSIVGLATNLSLEVIAEGVESKQQVHWLKAIGCRLAQGFYFDRPMSAEQYQQLLAEQHCY